MTNDEIINVAKEITIAMFSTERNLSPAKATGKVVAEFMQAIYDKVVELIIRRLTSIVFHKLMRTSAAFGIAS